MVQRKIVNGPAVEDASTGDSVDSLNAARRSLGGDRAYSDAVSERRKNKQIEGEPNWEQWAQDAFEDSTNFLDSSVRAAWERSDRTFQNRHPSGSKYHSEQYKHRSKIFRPKTRSMVRQFEAQAAQAYFGTQEVATVQPVDDEDKSQLASASLMQELLKYRLTTKNPAVAIPWFQTVLGAAQDATKYGVVISKQWWNYKERVLEDYELDDDGNPYTVEAARRVVSDKPEVTLLPPENVRIDRGADWLDPINSSPFVIVMYPMYIADIEARMREMDPKSGQPRWRDVGRAQLKAVGQYETWDSTRTHREGNRDDSKESEIAIDDYTIIWVHENFMRWNDVDWVYYTAGSEILLSDPVPVTQAYRHCREGERPIVMGYTVFEAHKIYPTSKIGLTEGLQTAANNIVNQRFDNVTLAMNKRWFVQRGRQVDLVSLTRSAPGSITMVNDVEKDVKEVDVRDVTSSAYAEQDRINADFDDIAGAINTGTIQTNRRLNETVGGMQLMAGSANQLGDLDLRWLNESWTERVLTQIIHMEQVYESDVTVLAMAGKKAKLIHRFGIDRITDELMAHDLTVTVNAGLGSQPPAERLQNFVMGAKTVKELLGDSLDPTMVNVEEIITEIFAPLGYKDGMRFFHFNDTDPRIPMLMQQIQQLTQQLDKRILDNETKRLVAEINAAAKVMQQQVENEGRLTEEKVRFLHEMEKRSSDHDASLRQQREQNMAGFIQKMAELDSQERQARERPSNNQP